VASNGIYRFFGLLLLGDMKTCKHCEGDLELANPSGYCSHIYYPEGCEICARDNLEGLTFEEFRELAEKNKSMLYVHMEYGQKKESWYPDFIVDRGEEDRDGNSIRHYRKRKEDFSEFLLRTAKELKWL
jgi:hypothetical protein